MRHLTTLAAVPLLLLTALPAQAQMATITPEQIGQIFCIGSLGNDMAPAVAMLTPDLAAVIDDAFARSHAFELEHPGDKPPMGDGVPWRTWQDYADGCTVVGAEVADTVALVTIAYSFSEYPDANYTNDLVLHEDPDLDNTWRIDDVDLGEGQTLRSVLAGAFENY